MVQPMAGLVENLFCGGPLDELAKQRKVVMEVQADNTACQASLSLVNIRKIELERKYNDLKNAAEASTSEKNKLIVRLQEDNTTLLNETIAKQQIIDALYQQAGQVTAFSMLSAAAQAKLTYYYSKYPEANVLYPGRVLENDKSKVYTMHVQSWAADGIGCPEAKKLVKDANGFVMDIMQTENVPFHRACDIALMRIKVYVSRNLYKYQFDSSTANAEEYWRFFIELYCERTTYGQGDDCDGWAVFHHVLWRTAGIPAEALRIVGGMTRTNEGHASNTYFASDLKWRHVNSTTPYAVFGLDVLSLPLLNDNNDGMGMKTVWFSYNENRSWTFEGSPKGTDAKDFFNEQVNVDSLPKMLQYIKIFPQ